MAGNVEEERKSFQPPPDCPVFLPTIEEFADPLAYIAKIRPRAERYGICKIVPPEGWNPPFSLNVDTFKFTPRIQRLNELEAHTRIKINFLERLSRFWELNGSVLQVPAFGKKSLDLHRLYELVRSKGGFGEVKDLQAWTQFSETVAGGKITGEDLKNYYEKILYPLELHKEGKCLSHLKLRNPRRGRKRKSQVNGQTVDDPMATIICQKCGKGDHEDEMLLCEGCDESWHTFCLKPKLDDIPPGDWYCPKCVSSQLQKVAEGYGFEQASQEYTLSSFGRMADDFKAKYFDRPSPQEVSVDEVEQTFWKIVGNVDTDVQVEYGADLHSMDHGSGFPTKCNEVPGGVDPEQAYYRDSPWNLNNLPILKESLFNYVDSDISGMMVPWMYVGMCFSAFCWHNEDHWSYSINYLHWGEPKTWYGVPGDWAMEFEKVMKGQANELFENQPDLLHQLVTIMNPNILMEAGIPIYRAMHYPGEFVVTFPKAYHAGFNQGYNFAEAVNFCPADWLPKGRHCIRHYSEAMRFCVFSQDELVCKMAAEAQDVPLIVAMAVVEDLTRLRNAEARAREDLVGSGCTKSRKEFFEFLSDDARQCGHCKTVLFLSGVACPCSTKYSCLRDYKEVCDCPVVQKVLCYRYTLDRLTEMIAELKARTVPLSQWTAEVVDCLKKIASRSEKPTYQQLESLLTRADLLKYNQSELYTKLRTVVDQCEKFSHISRRILHLTPVEPLAEISGKKGGDRRVLSFNCKPPPVETELSRCRRSHPHSNSCELRPVVVKAGLRTDGIPKGSSYAGVPLQELEQFVENVASLPVVIPEYEGLKVLLATAKAVYANVEVLLGSPDLGKTDVPKIVAEARDMLVAIPCLNELEVKYECTLWLERVQGLLDSPKEITAEKINEAVQEYRTAFDAAGGKEAHMMLEGLLEFLTELNSTSETLLKAKPRIPFGKLDLFVKAARHLPAVKHQKELSDLLLSQVEWMYKLKKMVAAPTTPLIQELEPLTAEGKQIGIDLPRLETSDTLLAGAKKWITRVERTFSPRNGRVLLDVILPFPELKLEWKNFRTVRDHSMEGVLSRHGLTKAHFASSEKLAAACEEAAKKEALEMHELRLENLAKTELQCACSKPTEERPNIVRCELCKASCHAVCGGKPTFVQPEARMQSQTSRNVTQRFLCPRCDRAERVRFTVIVDLVKNLEDRSLGAIEGEALKIFLLRCVEWRKKAQGALAKPDGIFSVVQLPTKEEPKEANPSPTDAVPEADQTKDGSGTVPRPGLITGRAKIREETKACFEWLLMEGLLLNACLPELDEIWSLLQVVRKENEVHVVPDYIELEEEKRERGTVDNPVTGRPSKNGVDKSSPDASGSESSDSDSSSDSNSDSSTSSSDDSNSNSGSDSGSGSGSGSNSDSESESESDIVQKDSNDVPRPVILPTEPIVESVQPLSTYTPTEEDDMCKAVQCKFRLRLVPEGMKKVEWVQCDSCEEWFHIFCVNVAALSDVAGKHYSCPGCKTARKQSGRPKRSLTKRVGAQKTGPKPKANASPGAKVGQKTSPRATAGRVKRFPVPKATGNVQQSPQRMARITRGRKSDDP